MLELIKEALDEVAFAIKHKIARPLDRAVSLGRDDRSDSALGESFGELVGIVCLVAN